MSKLKLALLFIISLLLLPASYADQPNQTLITDDGREVLLNGDGSWKYLSTDRFANTSDGQRVRLKEDGSWQYMGNVLLTTDEQVRTSDLDFKLEKVVIETYKKKIQKNSKIKTQTVFYVNLAYSTQAKVDVSLKASDLSLIKVKDNNGKIYPVFSVKPNDLQIRPGAKSSVVIRVEKSPLIWDNVKSMAVTFKAGILGLEAPVTLRQKVDDFDEVNVDGFE